MEKNSILDKEFKNAVNRLVKQLKISFEYRKVLIGAIASKREKAALIAYTKKSRPLFRTLPGFVKEILHGYISNIRHIADMDIYGGEKHNKRENDSFLRGLDIEPLINLAMTTGLSSVAEKRSSYKSIPENSMNTNMYQFFELSYRKKKNPDAEK